MNIEIVATDVSDFKETGFGGIESCYNFYKAVKSIENNVRFNIIESLSDLKSIIKRKPNFVILGCKYIVINNKKFWLSNFFEKNNIPFLGTSYKNLVFDSNKELAKEKLKAAGIEVAKSFVVNKKNIIEYKYRNLKYPLFVKPLRAACSFGIDNTSLVNNYNELEKKVFDIDNNFGGEVLVEEFLPGREFTVAVIGNDELKTFPIELGDVSKNKFLTREIKIANLENPRILEDKVLIDKLDKLSKKIFRCLDVRDFCRIDFKLNENGEPIFLEINMFPGFNKGRSYFPLAFELNNNTSYDSCIQNLYKIGINRILRRKNYEI